jgi:hypothetical protein
MNPGYAAREALLLLSLCLPTAGRQTVHNGYPWIFASVIRIRGRSIFDRAYLFFFFFFFLFCLFFPWTYRNGERSEAKFRLLLLGRRGRSYQFCVKTASL